MQKNRSGKLTSMCKRNILYVGFMDWIKSLPYSELITGKEK